MSLQFVVCDYFATGEGSTKCILITRAYPSQEDYDEDMSYTTDDGTFHWVPSQVKEGVTSSTIALREFIQEFGSWYAKGAENLSKEEFLKRFSNHLPAWMPELIEKDDAPGFYYASRLHLNYS